ncbi:sulfurtransferase complex subunit TusD [Oceanicoccus sagamiensis]|uniref:Sulfurtransferase TusD n=1 Tax=Oceanicoccus sagamiensis TaxID=716816 RepID=A0A1X9ND84_9GAMM|nr:sulfurtransferase complex subunit TusD [Oceanicoccus sagamiensis]ARN75526.1 sulfurtransferase TusD [Oceanicoccus sagamiensis]
MRFSLLILGAPYSSQSVATALRFAQAAVDAGHNVYRIFFYHDAVNNGNALITPPQDENNIPQQWQILANQHDIDLVVCIASALKRGVMDAKEADRYEKPSHNLSDSVTLSGLGQLVDASINSDRLITFGP